MTDQIEGIPPAADTHNHSLNITNVIDHGQIHDFRPQASPTDAKLGIPHVQLDAGNVQHDKDGYITIDDLGMDLIKQHEGLAGTHGKYSSEAYRDNGGWSIGWGHHFTKRSDFPDPITEDQAKALLRTDIDTHAKSVLSLCHVPLNENQFAALVSFDFNLRHTAQYLHATIWKDLNNHRPDLAANEFHKWNLETVVDKETGKTVRKPNPELTRRRADERVLFTKPVDTGK